MINVVASYSRKFQFEYYGGNKFEASDHFASLGEELPNEEVNMVGEVYKRLYDSCRAMVNATIIDEIEKLGNKDGVGWAEFLDTCRKAARGEAFGLAVFEKLNEKQKILINEFKLQGKRAAYVPAAERK